MYPKPFCAIRFINYARYTEDEKELPTDTEMKASPDSYRRNNVTFVDTYKTDNELLFCEIQDSCLPKLLRTSIKEMKVFSVMRKITTLFISCVLYYS